MLISKQVASTLFAIIVLQLLSTLLLMLIGGMYFGFRNCFVLFIVNADKMSARTFP